MSLRVIAGTAKGTRLKQVPGDSTRPIMDRVKEALFGIIGVDIYDSSFLDLFAGTGSVAIEALSRGADTALMLDLDREAIKTIQSNLLTTGFTERAAVRRADALAFLAQPPTAAFDYIYVAPPQYQELWLKTVALLDQQPGWLAEDGDLIVQIDPAERQPVTLKYFTAVDERKYGKTLLIFFRRMPAQSGE